MANSLMMSSSLAAAAILLNGCGSSGGDGGSTTTTTSTPGGYPWKSNPIEVRGSHLFDSVTGKPFLGAGIAFPNLGDDAPVSAWIDVLRRIKKESSNVNLIRLYEFPPCIWDSSQGYCFAPFFQAADELGIYVLVPGTGTVTGYLPLSGWKTANDAYRQGSVLDFGRSVIQRFYYPNTLAVVIGNEFLRESTWPIATILKAYARDLKKYMAMCHDDQASPSYNKMRQVPLIYASNDDYGDEMDKQKAAYLFCGDASTSVDLFGVNVERWCDPTHDIAYDTLQDWVSAGHFPGAFVFTEMGCAKDGGYKGARDWAQVPDFFSKFSAFDGFSAYAYWNAGATNFNMFDGKGANATIYADGTNFFTAMKSPGERKQSSDAQAHPKCPTQIGVTGKMATLELLENVHIYNESNFPADECPSLATASATSIIEAPVIV